MFHLRQREKFLTKVKGFLQTPIQYEDRLQGRKWIDFAGAFEPQRWGNWDSNSCWLISAVNSIEDQLEFLKATNQFSEKALKFFKDNKYIDDVGDFSISERFGEILGKQGIDGGTSPLAWQIMQKWGCIPRKMLTYSLERSYRCASQEAFVKDYFNESEITEDMYLLGQQFRKYVNIAYQKIGKDWYTPNKDIMKAAIQQAPVCIGIPIPTNAFNWNNSFVQYDGNKVPAHEVELHYIDDKGQDHVSDQYNPDEKVLSKDYYICFATQGIIYSLSKPITATPAPTPTVEQTFWQRFWSAVNNYFNGIANDTPIG